MTIKNAINERYFEEESKAMYYVLGAFYNCYRPSTKYGNYFIFQSQYKDLVRIINKELESKYSITCTDSKHGRNSHMIYARSLQLKNDLVHLGLNAPREERKFPEKIKEENISHFVRGFIDATATAFQPKSNGYTTLEIHFNNLFLSELNDVLKKYAGVNREKKTDSNTIYYGHKNAIRIHDFIYKDWQYIQESGLCLPWKKELFGTDYVVKQTRATKLKLQKRIEAAITLFREGKYTAVEIANLVGYKSPPAFYAGFRTVTGEPLMQWMRENNIQHITKGFRKSLAKIEKSKEWMIQNTNPLDIFKMLGYSSYYKFSKAFERHTGKTITEWNRQIN